MGSRVAAMVLVGVVLAGVAGLHPDAFGTAPSPASPTCTLKFRQPGGAWTSITAVGRAKDPTDYYDYFSVSAHTDFVEAYVSKLYFYTNTLDGRLYLFFHHNIDDGGSPDAAVTFDFSPLPSGVNAVLSDDPGEFRLGRAVEGQWEFFLNTDGGVVGPFPTGAEWDFTITATWGGPDPMQAWRVVDGPGTDFALDMAKSVELARACNASPTAVAGGPYSGTEGSPVTFDAGGSSDPDGDALTYSWDWDGDGVFDEDTSSATVQHLWTDDFVGSVTLRVSDGELSATAVASVSVVNVPPKITVEPLPAIPLFEGGSHGVDIRVDDPGADVITVEWTSEGLGSAVHTFFTGTSPTRIRDRLAGILGDDGAYAVAVSAKDDDSGVDSVETTLPIANAAPSATVQTSLDSVGVAFRIAGEKWHDVAVSLLDADGSELASGSVVRIPGSRDDQLLDLGSVTVSSEAGLRAHVVYTPEDDPVNGQPNGANPAWMILNFTDGTQVRLHHTFNVRHNDTYVWDVDLFPTVVAHGVPFLAAASDRGSDDLTFSWSFGDGSTVVEIVFNNGVSPDPPKSPTGFFPFSASSTVRHVFVGGGTYVVTVVVTDDDGGMTSASFTINIP